MNVTNRDDGYCCTVSAFLFQLHPASVHVCSTFSWQAVQTSLPQGQQTYLPLRMFDYVALDQHTRLKPSSCVCYSSTRLAGTLQYPCFKLSFWTNRHDQTTWHVNYNKTRPACISVRLAFYQQMCLKQLQLTYQHICSCVAVTSRYICYTCLRPTVMSICSYPTNGLENTIAQDHQACFYSCTWLTVMPLLVAYYQHACLLQFHLINIHVYYICTRPSSMSLTVVYNQKSYL